MADPQPVEGPVVLVGCGRLGSAILEGWLLTQTVAASDLIILTPRKSPPQKPPWRRRAGQSAARGIGRGKVIVLAVKPALWRDVMTPLLPSWAIRR